MDIQNNNVTIQINATDQSGKRLRISDCDVFIVHVYTDDPKFYLTFSKRDMLMTEWVDELTIPKHQMEQLRSGVVQYTYDYLPIAHDCKYEQEDEDFDEEAAYRPHHPHHHNHTHFHEELIHSKPVVTSIYWRNIAHPHPQRPLNTVTLFDVERLHRLIEKERIEREKDVETLTQNFGADYSNKLDEEIERSTAEDEKINAEIEVIKSKFDEFSESADFNKIATDDAIKTNADDLKAEVVRATNKEIELEQLIQGEVSRAKSVEEVIDTKIVMEKERAVANESNINDRLVSLTDRFDSYKELSSETLKSEIERAKATESALNDKIQGVVNDLSAEVSRAAQKDIEHTNLVTTESNRAQAVENRLEENLSTEISRAKDAEKHLIDEVHGVQETVASLATATNVYNKAEVDKKISDVRNDVSTLENWVANHTDNTDELKTKVAHLVEDVDKAKSEILAEVAKCDAENNKLATEIQTLADSTYTKAETDSALNDINSSISSLENWKNNHSDNTDELKAKVAGLGADVDKVKTDLADEVTARTNENLTLSTKIELVEGKVDAETVRAKAVEKSLEDEITDVKTIIADKSSANADAITEVEANLTLEVARAKAAEKVLSDALEVVNGDVATAGSIKKSLADAKDYTDAEIAKLSLAQDSALADTLKAYATNEAVDKKISDVIGTAPEALDTLGKISNALSQDSDAISAINGILTGKVDSSVVYTQAEVDSKLTAVNNTLSTIETKVDNADSLLGSRINDAVAKISALESTADANNTALSDAISAEETARKAGDKTISDKLDAEVEKLTSKYNELNATVIADIADSTAKDTELEAKINANSAAISSEVNRAKQVETELNDKINAIDLAGANSNISSLSDKIEAEITRAGNAEKVISVNLADEVNRAKNAEKALDDKISLLDLTSLKNDVSTLDVKLDNAISTLQTSLENEVSRAKVAEKSNADVITTLQGDVTSAVANITALSASVTQFVADSTAKDTEIETAISNEKSRAESAESALSAKIDIINGDASTVGSLAHAIHDAEHYVDDALVDYAPKASVYTKTEVDQAIANVDVTEQLKDYATKSYVDDAVAVNITDDLDALSDKLDAEVKRAKAREDELFDLLSDISEIFAKAMAQ